MYLGHLSLATERNHGIGNLAHRPAAKSKTPYIDTGLAQILLVPMKGLEPPHPCEYVDLNHARLPIPPLRHGHYI